MGVNLRLLGMQSIPCLAEKIGIKVDFPNNVLCESLHVEDFQRYMNDCARVLDSFFTDFGISWWDIYTHSDIGRERLEIAREMQLKTDDFVLDIGCGRGYFSIAAAKFAGSVIGVDLMDGGGRHDWWKNFSTSMQELHLHHKVSGVKSSAKQLPFRSNSFDVAAAVHSIRNFQDHLTIEATIEEMKRVVRDDGSVCVVESLPLARTEAQEAHLQMFNCKVKYTSGELDFPAKNEMLGIFEEAEFKKTAVKELDYNLSAAPPLFCIDYYLPSLPEDEREEAKAAYNRAIEMIEKWGEVSPPALFLKGIV